MKTIIKDNVFDYVDAGAFQIKNDPKALAYIQNMPQQNKIIYAYNQYDFSYSVSACTLWSCIGIISSIFDEKLTSKQEEDFFRFAQKEYGYKEGQGNSSAVGAKAAAKWRNITYPSKPVVFFVDKLLTNIFQLALDKGLGIQTTIRGSTKFFQSLKKGEISTADGMNGNQGHSIALYDHLKFAMFVDSDSKASRATLTKDIMQGLINNHAFWAACRIFLPLQKISTLSPDEYKAAMQLVTARSAAWSIFKDKKYQDQLHAENNWWRSNAGL